MTDGDGQATIRDLLAADSSPQFWMPMAYEGRQNQSIMPLRVNKTAFVVTCMPRVFTGNSAPSLSDANPLRLLSGRTR